MTNYAPLIATVFDNETRDFPGVFHYEVTKPFGAWFAQSLHATGELPDSIVGIKKIGELAEAFFSQGGNHQLIPKRGNVLGMRKKLPNGAARPQKSR